MSDDRESAVLDRIEAFRRRRPRLVDDVVTLAHGAGGKASAALIDAVFVDAFSPGERAPLVDAATPTLPTGERLAFSTDSFVVQPRHFPGGSIGHLAVHGTVNDLAVMGARPAWLSVAFVIEEGFEIAELRVIVEHMATAAADGRRRDRHRRHQGGGQGCRRRPVHHDRWGRRPSGGPSPRRRSRRSRATSCSSRARSPITAWR